MGRGRCLVILRSIRMYLGPMRDGKSGAWRVFPHDPIEKLSANLWRVEGPVPKGPLRRVMTLVRRTNGDVVIHNGIALEDAAMKEIEAWGEPRFLVVPNRYHRLDAAAYKARYPKLFVVCPRGAMKAVRHVVEVDGSYADFPSGDDVGLEYVDGVREAEGVMRVRSEEGTTLVFNDLVFNMPNRPGFSGAVLRMLGSSGGPRVTRIFRMMIMKDGTALRKDLERLAAEPKLTRIIVSHEKVISERPADVLHAVAASL